MIGEPRKTRFGAPPTEAMGKNMLNCPRPTPGTPHRVHKVSVLAEVNPNKYPDLEPFLLPPLPPLQGGLSGGEAVVGCGVAGCGGFVLIWVIAFFVIFVFGTNGNKNIPPGVFIAAACIALFAWVIWAISTQTKRTSRDEELKKAWPAAEAIWRNDVYCCRCGVFFRGSDPEMCVPKEERVKLLLGALGALSKHASLCQLSLDNFIYGFKARLRYG